MPTRTRLAALLALTLALVALVATPADARKRHAVAADCTRYVATTGSDTAAGTAAAPWRTVLAAINKLTAGTVLCVKPGTYTQEVIDSSLPNGTATAPIVVKSYDPANRALLDGKFSVSNLHFWQIRDLKFTNPTPTSNDNIGARIVAFIGGADVTVGPNNEIFDSRYSGLLIGRSSATSSTWPMRYHVTGNYIHDTDYSGFYFNPGPVSDGNVIDHNLIVNSGSENLKVGWGSDCSGYTGGTNGYGAGGARVSYNTLVNAGYSGNLVFAEPGGQHPVTADHNLLYDPDSARGFHVRYDSATNSAAYPHGCLGDNVTVTETFARGWKPGSTAQIPFSEDFDDAPASQARETGTVLGLDPQFDANYVPQNPAAQAYGYAAP